MIRVTTSAAFENKPSGHRHTIALTSDGLDGRHRPIGFEDFRFDGQCLARRQEVAEFDVADFTQQHKGVIEIRGHADQPNRGLMQGFQHHDTRHDGESREMITKVFLIGRQSTLADESLAGLENRNAIELAVFHAANLSTQPKTPQPENRPRTDRFTDFLLVPRISGPMGYEISLESVRTRNLLLLQARRATESLAKLTIEPESGPSRRS